MFATSGPTRTLPDSPVMWGLYRSTESEDAGSEDTDVLLRLSFLSLFPVFLEDLLFSGGMPQVSASWAVPQWPAGQPSSH